MTPGDLRWRQQALIPIKLWNKLRDKLLIEICECGRWTKFAKTSACIIFVVLVYLESSKIFTGQKIVCVLERFRTTGLEWRWTKVLSICICHRKRQPTSVMQVCRLTRQLFWTVCKQVHHVESWMEDYWKLCGKNARNIKALMYPLHLWAIPLTQIFFFFSLLNFSPDPSPCNGTFWHRRPYYRYLVLLVYKSTKVTNKEILVTAEDNFFLLCNILTFS